MHLYFGTDANASEKNLRSSKSFDYSRGALENINSDVTVTAPPGRKLSVRPRPCQIERRVNSAVLLLEILLLQVKSLDSCRSFATIAHLLGKTSDSAAASPSRSRHRLLAGKSLNVCSRPEGQRIVTLSILVADPSPRAMRRSDADK